MQLHYFYCSLIFFLLNTNFFVLLSIFKPVIKVLCHCTFDEKMHEGWKTKAANLASLHFSGCILYTGLGTQHCSGIVSLAFHQRFKIYDLRYFVQMMCLSDISCVCQYGESGNNSLVLKTKLPFLKTKVFFKRLFIHLKKLSF